MRNLSLCLSVLGILLVHVHSLSVNEGEEIIQRRLGETIVTEDRMRYETLLAHSSNLRKEIAKLSRLLPDESASDRVKQINIELQETIRSTIAISQQSTTTVSRSYAAEQAIERARKRDNIRRLESEKKKREVEDFNYIQNMRKMELVDNTVVELQSRAAFHGLNEYGTSRVEELLREYRMMEADYIFNGTNVQAAQAQRRYIEKFIGDSQAIEITNKQRQKELLDRTIQELAARGVSFMCRSEMKTLDEMLATYRNYGFKLIDLLNSKDPTALIDEIASTQKATQTQKLMIEKFIGTTKSTSQCATGPSPKRHFSSKGASA